MDRRVVFRPTAEADLERIRKFCMGFAQFAERGTLRDDLRGGIRVVGFERRVRIAFHVLPDAVEIATIVHGGRDIGKALEGGSS